MIGRDMDFKGNEPDDEFVAVVQGTRPFDSLVVDERSILASQIANANRAGIVVDDDAAVVAADKAAWQPDMAIGTAADQKFGLNHRVVGGFQDKRALVSALDGLENDFHGTTSLKTDRPALVS